MGNLKLLLLGAATVAVTGPTVHSGSGGGCCLFSCGDAKAPAAVVAKSTPKPSVAETYAPPVAGLRAYVDSNGNLTSTPPPGTKAAAVKSAGKPYLVFSHYVDPNDPSRGAVMVPMNWRTSSVAKIGADGKVTTQCLDGSGKAMTEPEGHEEAHH